MRVESASSLLALLLATSVRLGIVHGYSYTNVFGDQLQPCCSEGMALTGYTRTGYCVDEDDDSGSHHICIDLSSTNTEENFCEVTGQNDWCSSMMPCDDGKGYQTNDGEGDDDDQCQVQNWCVCQWAFANYIQTAGGCNYVQDIVCESINQQALIAYKSKMNKASKYQDALECIVDRCGISIDDIPTGNVGRLSHMSIETFNSRRAAAWALVVVVSAAAAGAAYYTSRRQMTQVGEGAYLAANDKQVTKGAVG